MGVCLVAGYVSVGGPYALLYSPAYMSGRDRVAGGGSSITIRLARLGGGEDGVVDDVIREAFWDHFQPGADEHYLAHCLRESPDFIPELCFVAEVDGRVVGAIVYSKSSITTTKTGTYGLSPALPVRHGPTANILRTS